MGIAENLKSLKDHIPPGVKLIAVSKTRPAADLMEAYRAGQRAFGENKVQEMAAKQPLMPADTEWHFIGHLQTNKVRFIAPRVDLIHSIDSLKLLAEVNREAAKNSRTIDCLLQFHIATEETKYGLEYREALEILESDAYRSMQNIRITGVMGMATYSDDEGLVRSEFRMLRRYFGQLRDSVFSGSPEFREISMGMSGDYRLAVEEGSTMVRIGTMVFGERKVKSEE